MGARIWNLGPCLIFVGVQETQTVSLAYLKANTTTLPVFSDATSSYSVADPQVLTYTVTKPKFLGTAEFGPVVQFRPRYRDINTSESGPQVPEDLCFQSEDAIIQAPLTYWDELVLSQVVSRPFMNRQRGAVYADSVGTLMQREGKAHQLWLLGQNASGLAFSNNQRNIGGRGAFPANPVNAIVGAAGNLNIAAALSTGAAANPSAVLGWHFFQTMVVGPDVADPIGSRARKMAITWRAIPERKNNQTASSQTLRKLYDFDMTALNNLGAP